MPASSSGSHGSVRTGNPRSGLPPARNYTPADHASASASAKEPVRCAPTFGRVGTCGKAGIRATNEPGEGYDMRTAKIAVAIRHVLFEDLGLLAPLLLERGYEFRYREAGTDSFAGLAGAETDLLIVLGGPIGAYEEGRYPFLREELRVLEKRAASNLPTLGICLGAQLLARTLGGRVFPMGRKEIGFSPLHLTAEGLASPLAALDRAPVLHWHGDTYTLPAGARRLASTELCREQAFTFGNAILAVQFHPEWDATRFESWLIGHAVELAQAGIEPGTLRSTAREVGTRAMAAGRKALADWLDACLQTA